ARALAGLLGRGSRRARVRREALERPRRTDLHRVRPAELERAEDLHRMRSTARSRSAPWPGRETLSGATRNRSGTQAEQEKDPTREEGGNSWGCSGWVEVEVRPVRAAGPATRPRPPSFLCVFILFFSFVGVDCRS